MMEAADLYVTKGLTSTEAEDTVMPCLPPSSLLLKLGDHVDSRTVRVKRLCFVSERVHRIRGPRHAFTAVCTGVGFPELV